MIKITYYEYSLTEIQKLIDNHIGVEYTMVMKNDFENFGIKNDPKFKISLLDNISMVKRLAAMGKIPRQGNIFIRKNKI